MKKVRAIFAMLLVLCMALIPVTGALCEGSGSTDDALNGVAIKKGIYEGKTIRIWTPWAPAEQPKDAVDFSEHTGLTIKYEQIPFGDDENASEYRQAFINAMAAGNGPDVVEAGNFAMPVWANKNLVQAWDEYIDFSAGLDALNMTSAMETMFAKDGKHYGVADKTAPLWNSSVIFYIKSAFENAGLDDPYELFKAGKWDWDTLVADAQRLTYDGGSGSIDHWGMTTWFPLEPFVSSNGGDAVKVIDGKPTYSLNAPEAIAALNFAKEKMPAMPETDSVGPDAYFAEGTAAMYYEGYWYIDDAHDLYGDDLGMVPFPNGPDYNATPSRDYGEWCWAWMLTSSSQEPQAAADYFRYVFATKDNEGEADYEVWGGEEMYREVLEWCGDTAMDTARGYGDLSYLLYDEVWQNLTEDTPANLTQAVAQEAQAIIDDSIK